MAEGVDRISNSLDSISLSSNPEERDALEAALNLPEDHAMIPDDMVKKIKRREEEKQRAKEDRKEKTRHKDEREQRRKREQTDHNKERRKSDKREHGSEEKHESTRKRKAEEKPRTRSYSPQDRRKTGITYDFL